MATKAKDSEVIDLSELKTLTKNDIAAREQELNRLEGEIAELQMRQHELIVELGLGDEMQNRSGIGSYGSALFLNQAADIFKDAPEESLLVAHPMEALDIDDSEFESRFETFLEAESGGDEKARRWLSQS